MANDDVARVWDLMEKISFCMLATWNGSELRSRPMDARVRRKEGVIYFLTDARHLKDDEIARYPKLNLAFADTGAMKYVSLSGEAKVTNDRAKIKELWEPVIKTWFTEGEEDPRITVIQFTPTDGYYWDTKHGNAVAGIKMMAGAMLGKTMDDSIEGKLDV